jgi:hypothetical protein
MTRAKGKLQRAELVMTALAVVVALVAYAISTLSG